MRKLQVNTILEYYDVPQIFIAEDAVGINYICVLYDQFDEKGLKYIAVQVSTEKISSFISGGEDLRALFENPLVEDSIYDVLQSNGELFLLPLSQGITEDMLPLEGYYYENNLQNDDEIIIAQTLACRHPIVRLGFEDETNSHTIDASCLSQALAHYQSLISNCYKKIKGKDLNNHTELRVTTFQAASFDVHFQVNAPLDLFGSSDLYSTFKQLDYLFAAPNDQVFMETVQKLCGHTINSYKNFLEVLIEHKLSIKYKWVASITDTKVVEKRMSLPKIEQIHDLLLESQELQSEDKKFEGIFLASSVENGKWVFKPNNERKNINGVSENNEILSGVIIEQQVYCIYCKEIQEQSLVSLKITKKLVLSQIEKIVL